MARKHDTSGHRRTQRKRLENRTAGTPITPDNLLTNSATVSDESPQESYHKNSEKPLVLAFFGSLPSAGLRKVEYGRTAGNLTICRQILPPGPPEEIRRERQGGLPHSRWLTGRRQLCIRSDWSDKTLGTR